MANFRILIAVGVVVLVLVMWIILYCTGWWRRFVDCCCPYPGPSQEERRERRLSREQIALALPQVDGKPTNTAKEDPAVRCDQHHLTIPTSPYTFYQQAMQLTSAPPKELPD